RRHGERDTTGLDDQVQVPAEGTGRDRVAGDPAGRAFGHGVVEQHGNRFGHRARPGNTQPRTDTPASIRNSAVAEKTPAIANPSDSTAASAKLPPTASAARVS